MSKVSINRLVSLQGSSFCWFQGVVSVEQASFLFCYIQALEYRKLKGKTTLQKEKHGKMINQRLFIEPRCNNRVGFFTRVDTAVKRCVQIGQAWLIVLRAYCIFLYVCYNCYNYIDWDGVTTRTRNCDHIYRIYILDLLIWQLWSVKVGLGWIKEWWFMKQTKR